MLLIGCVAALVGPGPIPSDGATSSSKLVSYSRIGQVNFLVFFGILILIKQILLSGLVPRFYLWVRRKAQARELTRSMRGNDTTLNLLICSLP
jgi:hypothetical protein